MIGFLMTTIPSLSEVIHRKSCIGNKESFHKKLKPTSEKKKTTPHQKSTTVAPQLHNRRAAIGKKPRRKLENPHHWNRGDVRSRMTKRREEVDPWTIEIRSIFLWKHSISAVKTETVM
jgi:hypothetical protein